MSRAKWEPVSVCIEQTDEYINAVETGKGESVQ